VEITPADLSRLDPEEFLNDTIIDFYMRSATPLINRISHEQIGIKAWAQSD